MAKQGRQYEMRQNYFEIPHLHTLYLDETVQYLDEDCKKGEHSEKLLEYFLLVSHPA